MLCRAACFCKSFDLSVMIINRLKALKLTRLLLIPQEVPDNLWRFLYLSIIINKRYTLNMFALNINPQRRSRSKIINKHINHDQLGQSFVQIIARPRERRVVVGGWRVEGNPPFARGVFGRHLVPANICRGISNLYTGRRKRKGPGHNSNRSSLRKNGAEPLSRWGGQVLYSFNYDFFSS